MDDPVVNEQAKNLTKAIFQHESGMKYDAVGDNGTSHGAGQWQDATWRAHAKDVLGDENAPMTPDNQSVVAQGTIRKLIKQGKNAAQIAAIWNSGNDQNWENKIGTTVINGKPINYNVPKYVKDVTDLYQQYKGQSPSLQSTQKINQPNAPQQQDQSLGQELIGRSNDVAEAFNKSASGEINPLSGILQTAGAVGGAVGDVSGKVFDLIPGVKQLEGLIGKGVGKLAQTPAGQAVSKSIQEFSEKHPELSKDIGAGFNILTAIPIFKGLGAIKNVALDATAQALKGVAEKGATKDLTEAISRTVGGRNTLTKSPDVIKTMINERVLPEIENGKYSVQNAHAQLGDAISKIEDTELQPLVQSVNNTSVSSRIPLEDIRKDLLSDVRNEFRASGTVGKAEAEINRTFNDLKGSYGDYLTPQDALDIKRGIRKSVNFNSPKLEQDVTYHIGQRFQKVLEKALPESKAINQKMARLIQAQKALKYLEGRPVKEGLFRSSIKNVATGVGEAMGNATGIPVAGAFAGRGVGGFIEKKLGPGIYRRALERTGKNAVKTPVKVSLKKIGKAASYTAANKLRKD